jgi:hypothetical protein
VAIKTGATASITARDQELLRALAFCPLLTAEQVSRLALPAPSPINLKTPMKRNFCVPESGFANEHSARQRMYVLKKKGYVAPYKAGFDHPTMWRLTQAGHYSIVHDILWLEKTYGIDLPYNNYEPDHTRTYHYHSVTEVFVAIQPILTELYGPLPAWDWMSERRAFESFTAGGVPTSYMPDAEIVFGKEDLVMVLELQTRFAQTSSSEIVNKVEQHAERLSVRLSRGVKEFQLLFACELPRDAGAASESGRRLGVNVVADSPAVIVQHIRETGHIYHAATNTSARDTSGRIPHDSGPNGHRPPPAPNPILGSRRDDLYFDDDDEPVPF